MRRGTEVVVTGAPRKRLVRKGTWVRIPPSPPISLPAVTAQCAYLTERRFRSKPYWHSAFGLSPASGRPVGSASQAAATRRTSITGSTPHGPSKRQHPDAPPSAHRHPDLHQALGYVTLPCCVVIVERAAERPSSVEGPHQPPRRSLPSLQLRSGSHQHGRGVNGEPNSCEWEPDFRVAETAGSTARKSPVNP